MVQKKITFVFSIELHKDDLKVLKQIQEKLGIGNIRINKDKCVFTVVRDLIMHLPVDYEKGQPDRSNVCKASDLPSVQKDIRPRAL